MYEAMTARFASSGLTKWIGLHKRMVGGAAGACGLRTAQPRALREHGVHACGISVGRTVVTGHHHGIFRLISVSSITRKISRFSPTRYEKISTRWNTRNDLFWLARNQKRGHIRRSGKITPLRSEARRGVLSLARAASILADPTVATVPDKAARPLVDRGACDVRR
jgi:hypothetical protein